MRRGTLGHMAGSCGWRTGRGHVAGGHMVHADAREGRHVVGGSASEGPTG